MKKITKLILALVFVICLPVLCLAGCNKKSTAINMLRYFETSVSYQLYSNETGTTNISTFLDSKADAPNKYTRITFTALREWIYKMTLEKITFDIYSNIDLDDFELTMEITNLKKGDTQSSSSTFTKTIPIHLVKGKAVPVRVDINDYVESYTATTTIKLLVKDRTCFESDTTGDGITPTGLMFDIINFQLYGVHP